MPQNSKKIKHALPPGVKLLRALKGHREIVTDLAFDPNGDVLASGSYDETVKLWKADSGELLHRLKGHEDSISSLVFHPHGHTLATASYDKTVMLWDVSSGKLLRTLGLPNNINSLAFDPHGETLASGSLNGTVALWEVSSGELLRTLKGHRGHINNVVFNPQGDILASVSDDATVKLWDSRSGELLRTLKGHKKGACSVAFDPQGKTLASGGDDHSVKLWDPSSGNLLRTLEGHTGHIDILTFSSDGRLLITKSGDHTIRLWNCETWGTVAVIPTPTMSYGWIPALAYHPRRPLLVASTSPAKTPEDDRCKEIYFWELDYDVLLGTATIQAVHHTTGKIVLVGDHSVGKSALGHRLIHEEFKVQASTHGQQFWVFPALGTQLENGTECEAILWDFAGQPDYRLVHALFLDNADMALVLFDASDLHDPLHGVRFWLKQLQIAESRCPIILVAAQIDRGIASLTSDELIGFCEENGIAAFVETSARTGHGIDELIERMKLLISWDTKATTVTTTTFKRIKDYVLNLKEVKSERQTIVTPVELRERLEVTDPEWQFTDDEMLTAVGHLENYGYVKRLRTSKGEVRILLKPEMLNNLASSFVLEARRNPKGLGALEEKRLLSGGYDFPEVRDLNHSDRDVLLDSAVLLFLEHNVCFRETDPLRLEPYLVFPELINLKKPLSKQSATEDAASYTVTGPTENVFASLVVLLGYTHIFRRTAQWQNNARYEVGEGLVCGFRQEPEPDGELHLVLCFGPTVGHTVRRLFQAQLESFLAARDLTVQCYEPVQCRKNHVLNRAVVRDAMQQGQTTTFCSKCGEEMMLPVMAKPLQLTQEVQVEVHAQSRAAGQRTPFEQAVFRLCAYTKEQKITPPECFISYAWGEPEHERWVEKRLVDDLLKAGLQIVFDRRDNQIGDSLTRFISRIPYCACVVVVGTPLYFRKFENRLSTTGSVVAAEVDLISQRLIGAQGEKRTVKTLLLAGEKKTSLPPLMWDAIHADFRNEESYFTTAFDLILSLYDLPPTHSAVADLRESLRRPGFAFRKVVGY
ncbi:MAG TPA: GTP-binding protein [Pyrinomonadaceae bacterium]|nr:GTP-binding protein [Pyrinomonadaceae bacterium]